MFAGQCHRGGPSLSHGVVRIADVVLLELPGSPAGDVEPAVVDGEVDVAHERRHCAERLQRRRKLGGLGGLGGNGDHLLRLSVTVFAVPEPDGGGEISDAGHDADETPGLARVVRGAQLEHHLVLVAEIDTLEELPLREVPEIEV
jgi:hypothetical protein